MHKMEEREQDRDRERERERERESEGGGGRGREERRAKECANSEALAKSYSQLGKTLQPDDFRIVVCVLAT